MVLVLRPGALGDTLLAVPALRALRAAGFAPLTLAAHAGAARLLASLGEVERGLAFDDPSLTWVLGDSPYPEGIVAWLNPPDTPAFQSALIVASSRPHSEQHCAEYLLETLAPLGVEKRVDDGPFRIMPRRTDEILIHPGSGSPAKNWPAERFADTIRLLKRPVRLIVGEADARAAAAIEAELGRGLPHLEQPALEDLAARLAGCYGYLGNDSGVSHLAGLCGARTVVLFGPTSPTVWRPLGPHVATYSFDAAPDVVPAALA